MLIHLLNKLVCDIFALKCSFQLVVVVDTVLYWDAAVVRVHLLLLNSHKERTENEDEENN